MMGGRERYMKICNSFNPRNRKKPRVSFVMMMMMMMALANMVISLLTP
jgi:hypothetical protein